MPGYLDEYGAAGAAAENRARIVKRSIATVVLVLLAGAFVYYGFLRTWSETKVVEQFLATLDRQDFQGAYKMWGCTQDTPCKAYDPARFNQDWGPDTPYSKGSAAEIANTDFCDSGVVFELKYPNADPVSLWVDRSNKIISFAPWPQCPKRHWEFKRFFKSLFAKES